ncbi:MAG: hypothetical protein JXQ85_10695 [Cognatishimia sp.]|uniref:hypothetical protein n=1 Tax=Cognatishimia sp. TaxID=2211648 RepID=UPI003B8C123E
MIEVSHNPQIAQAYRKAHAERAAIFAKIFSWFTKSKAGDKDVPLVPMLLTEPSR